MLWSGLSFLSSPFCLFSHGQAGYGVTVQVLHTPVCSLETLSNVDSLGKGETLLSEKALLCKLAVQPANESVPKSAILQKVPKFADGGCLAELRYILRYRLQQFLIPAMEMKSLFEHQWP